MQPESSRFDARIGLAVPFFQAEIRADRREHGLAFARASRKTRARDIHLSLNRKEIRSRSEFYRELRKNKPGERISFHILREDESLEVEVARSERHAFYRS